MNVIFLFSLHLGLKHEMFGDFVQRRPRKFIVSKLFIVIMTSEWSVKGKFQKVVSFSRRYIQAWDRKGVLKFLFPLLPLHSKLRVLLFVIQVNENVSSLTLSDFIMTFFTIVTCIIFFFHSYSCPVSYNCMSLCYFHAKSKRIYPFSKTSRPAVGPTEPPV
jgi:hypothetical protein